MLMEENELCVYAKILDCEMETQYRNEKSVCEHWENESSNVFSGTLNPTHSRFKKGRDWLGEKNAWIMKWTLWDLEVD